MNDYLNQLKALMDFYDKSGAGASTGGGYSDAWGGGDLGMNQANANGSRLNFALRQMQQMNAPSAQPPTMPDFFDFSARGQPQAAPSAPSPALLPPIRQSAQNALARAVGRY